MFKDKYSILKHSWKMTTIFSTPVAFLGLGHRVAFSSLLIASQKWIFWEFKKLIYFRFRQPSLLSIFGVRVTDEIILPLPHKSPYSYCHPHAAFGQKILSDLLCLDRALPKWTGRKDGEELHVMWLSPLQVKAGTMPGIPLTFDCDCSTPVDLVAFKEKKNPHEHH